MLWGQKLIPWGCFWGIPTYLYLLGKQISQLILMLLKQKTFLLKQNQSSPMTEMSWTVNLQMGIRSLSQIYTYRLWPGVWRDVIPDQYRCATEVLSVSAAIPAKLLLPVELFSLVCGGRGYYTITKSNFASTAVSTLDMLCQSAWSTLKSFAGTTVLAKPQYICTYTFPKVLFLIWLTLFEELAQAILANPFYVD